MTNPRLNEDRVLALAWAAVEQDGCLEQIEGLKSIRFSPAEEFQEVFGLEDPEARDTWHVRFLLKLDEGVVSQIPSCIHVRVDDQTSEVVIDQML